MRKILVLAIAVALIFPFSSMAAYPEKPIKLIVPSKAGGSTDTTARLFIKSAKKFWPDADFVIKNVGGSGGQKGFEEIASARPNGYTFGMVFTTQIVAHIVSKRARYTLDSFRILGNSMQDPLIIAVPADSPYNSMDAFINAAKEKSMTTAVNGIGSDDFVAAKKLELQTGVAFNLMPTKGSTEQKAMILGGHIDASVMNLSQLQAQHKSGKAKILAILDDQRSGILPEVKTAKEQGYPVSMTATRGFVAPAKVDKKILTKLEELVQNVNNDPEFQAACDKSVMFRLPMSGADYRAYLTNLQAETQVFYDKTPW